MCIADQALALVSTHRVARSRTPNWARLASIIETTLPALRFSWISLGGPTRAANEVLAYLSPTGTVLAFGLHSTPTFPSATAQEVIAGLRKRDGDWKNVDPEGYKLVSCNDLHLRDVTVLQLRERTRAATRLSPRDAELVHWLARGLTNKEIASLLVTRPSTIKRAPALLYARTGAGDRTELLHMLR